MAFLEKRNNTVLVRAWVDGKKETVKTFRATQESEAEEFVRLLNERKRTLANEGAGARTLRDFFYAEEWDEYLKKGVLTRLDTAFSRDQAEKIYVQDRLREHAGVLKQWLADGAVIYICGSLQGMASGVDQVLNEVLGAAEVERLIEQGRYRRDVY